MKKTFQKSVDFCRWRWYNRQALEMRAQRKRKDHKKLWKKFWKPLDKRETMWYNIKAFEKEVASFERTKMIWKKLWKKFEKPLDKLDKMWYNNRVVWEIRKTELRKAPWKLNNTERINITLSIPWQKCRGWEMSKFWINTDCVN